MPKDPLVKKRRLNDLSSADDLDDSSFQAAVEEVARPRRSGPQMPKLQRFADYVAACALVRALRPFHGWHEDGTPIVVAVVIPAGWRSYFKAALQGFLRPTFASQGDIFFLDSKDRARIRDESFRQALKRTRLIVVTEDASLLPADFEIAADGVVTVDGVDPRHVHAAAHRNLGARLTEAQARKAAAAPVERLVAFRKGRRVTESFRRLEMPVAEEEAPAERPAAPLPTLDDLHGLGEAGTWGRELAIDLADWQAGRIGWADVDRGILLSGPPGTGKTTFAGALARTCGVHLVVGSIGRWQAKGHLGDMLKAMRAAFDEANKHAPSIVFIDEVDAIGDRETFDPRDVNYCSQVVAALLECIDGADSREGVVVVGACNHPSRLDAALIRPGRLDRHVHIPLPDAEGREGILRWHLGGALPDADLSGLAGRTEGWSGAALEQIVRSGRRTARRARRDMVLDDLSGELPSMVPIQPVLVWRSCVHEAGHAVVGEALEWRVRSAMVVSEIPSGEREWKAGGVAFENDDTHSSTRAMYLDRIVRALSGSAAEEVFFGDRADGAGGTETSDLARATTYASIMEASVGLGQGLAYLGAFDSDIARLVRVDFSLRRRVDEVLAACLERARGIVQERREDVERVAEALRARGRLSGDEVRELLDRQPRLLLVSQRAAEEGVILASASAIQPNLSSSSFHDDLDGRRIDPERQRQAALGLHDGQRSLAVLFLSRLLDRLARLRLHVRAAVQPLRVDGRVVEARAGADERDRSATSFSSSDSQMPRPTGSV
ncbi:AAA family ATPase [Tianweitania sediminis]|uniref:AAA family ATPase n=1 Tax=Tianweitania sediminis TaxID=1502156 RepID=A0A8J7UI49_9HYPH|nr:AAA family ATPase [Tianweitania sediminis]MBP0439894.1 AAA family ATPase [Tianweitania sediminis]